MPHNTIEKRREYMRKKRATKEWKIKEKRRRQTDEYRQHYRDYYKVYREREAGRIRIIQIRSRAKTRGIPVLCSNTEFIEWWDEQNIECFYCCKKADKKRHLHVDRLDNSVGYKIGNIALACNTCNELKRDVFTADEWKEIAVKYDLKNR